MYSVYYELCLLLHRLSFLGAFEKLRKTTISFDMSVCLSLCFRPPAWNNSAPTGRILMNFDIWIFFRKFFEYFQVSLKYDKNCGYITWRPVCVYDKISLNPAWNEKCFRQSYREHQNTYFMFSSFFFFENCVIYNSEKWATDDNIIPRMRYARWITNATDRHNI